jgi:hypothetical protein
MGEWIFTFGRGHTHPDTGERLENFFVAIDAETREEARAKMVRSFGLKWAGCYDSRDDAGVDEFGLTMISLRDAMKQERR